MYSCENYIQQKKEYEDIRLLTGLKFDDKASDIIPRMQTCLEIHGIKKLYVILSEKIIFGIEIGYFLI